MSHNVPLGDDVARVSVATLIAVLRNGSGELPVQSLLHPVADDGLWGFKNWALLIVLKCSIPL